MTKKVNYYFKLFGNIKDESEVHFAELELNSLFGEVKRVNNFINEFTKPPLQYFSQNKVRCLDNTNIKVQDIFTYELPYGKCQGFKGVRGDIENVTRLVKRLAYISEIIVITQSNDEGELLKKVFSTGKRGINVQCFKIDEKILLRLITNQYFLENSQYISKISNTEKHINDNVRRLLHFRTKDLYRIPSSSTALVGKRLEDYFTIREEPSLYLTHYMHPYKGKFHPKMVRSFLNYIYPESGGLVMDNFAGCGTLLVEATWMGLQSIGVEINPLSVLMSNVKCDALTLNPSVLKKEIKRFRDEVKSAIEDYKMEKKGQKMLFESRYDFKKIKKRKSKIPEKVKKKRFKNHSSVDSILVAREVFENYQSNISEKKEKEKISQFLHLALSGTISDMSRRKSGRFTESLRERLWDLYLRVYLFKKLNDVLQMNIGDSETYIGDARNMKGFCEKWNGEKEKIDDDSIDAIVNSPPYSTALDYIKNDYPQLTLLDLPSISLENLGKYMIGTPQMRYYTNELKEEIESNHKDFVKLPKYAKIQIKFLLERGRKKMGLRTYKFFKDMYTTLEEMARVMKKGGKCAIVIGNNIYKVGDEYKEIKNDKVLLDIAKKEDVKLKPDEQVYEILKENAEPDKVKPGLVWRFLQKTRKGNIRYESIVFLEKE